MSFLLVDDRFWTHDKVVAVLMSDKRPDRGTIRFIAIAAWTIMGSFCAGQRSNDGRFTLPQTARHLHCDLGRARAALDMLVEHRMLVDQGDGRYVFVNWSKWRRPRKSDRAALDVDPGEELSQGGPKPVQAQAEPAPRPSQALAEAEPRESQGEPSLFNDSDRIDPPSNSVSSSYYPVPKPVPEPDPHPLGCAGEGSAPSDSFSGLGGAKPKKSRARKSDDAEAKAVIAMFHEAWGDDLGVALSKSNRDRIGALLNAARERRPDDPMGVIREAMVASCAVPCFRSLGSPFAAFCAQPWRNLQAAPIGKRPAQTMSPRPQEDFPQNYNLDDLYGPGTEVLS